MFAVLASSGDDDDDVDDDVISSHERLDRSSTERSTSSLEDVSSSASSSSDDDDDASDAVWLWSTGRDDTHGDGDVVGARARRARLAPGEKRTLRRLGVAAKRAARAKRDGFDPRDALRVMESVVRDGKGVKIALSKRGWVAKAQGRVVMRLASALGLRCEPAPRARKRATFIVERVEGESEIPASGSEDWLTIERVCASPMTREEYLTSEEHGARLERRYAQARQQRSRKKDRGRRWKANEDEARERSKRDGAVDFERGRDDDVDDGARRGPRSTPASEDFGAFEAHTRGIGGRLLARMGFTPGLGLGRSNQGIAEAPVAEERPKRAGLGA